MIGMLTWTPAAGGLRQKSVTLEARNLFHMRVAWTTVARGPRTPEAVTRRRVLTAAKRLRRAGVTRVVLPEGFSYGAQLEKCGVAPVSTLPLRRALAADLTRTAMAARYLSGGSARVAVVGDQLSGELVRAVTELALGHRYVLVDVPYGAEALAAQLRREYGVSLLLLPAREQLEEADVLVLFAARTDLRRKNPVVLPLYDETAPLPPLLLPPALEDQLPQGLQRPQLLAALVEGGVLRCGQITVGTAERGTARSETGKAPGIFAKPGAGA